MAADGLRVSVCQCNSLKHKLVKSESKCKESIKPVISVKKETQLNKFESVSVGDNIVLIFLWFLILIIIIILT